MLHKENQWLSWIQKKRKLELNTIKFARDPILYSVNPPTRRRNKPNLTYVRSIPERVDPVSAPVSLVEGGRKLRPYPDVQLGMVVSIYNFSRKYFSQESVKNLKKICQKS